MAKIEFRLIVKYANVRTELTVFMSTDLQTKQTQISSLLSSHRQISYNLMRSVVVTVTTAMSGRFKFMIQLSPYSI